MDYPPSRTSELIAIVGSSCKFPGAATSPSKLWDLLRSPRDVLRDFPTDRITFANFYGENHIQHGRTDVKGKSYLLEQDHRLFDASFFRISPKEAQNMDPQHRLVLETTFEAIEAAGWPLNEISNSPTAVFAGCMSSDYHDIQMRDPDTLGTYTATGTARSILSNRLSYFFNLKGPCMTIDTACSSSLVALHQAVQCLRNGDASQAIVVGTSLLLDPSAYIAESKLRMLSPDSRCRMWDEEADGYARAEGTAAIILKPLDQAIRDNDHIECVIRNTGVNSDGTTDGVTMPSSASQGELIRETYRKAGLDPVNDRCQYFECHGTGTLAGDPVEARAIQEVFFPDGVCPRNAPLYCGSIKTVVGHLEGCAGLAGVLKASIALQNQHIPPNMHFKALNPAIAPYYAHLKVPTSLISWPQGEGKPLRASVNSFGFGGTNAHVILESFPGVPGSGKLPVEHGTMSVPSCGPFTFSAKSQSSLFSSLKQWSDYIRNAESIDLTHLSWVLNSRRTAFQFRLAVAASKREDLIESIDNRIQTAMSSGGTDVGIRVLPGNGTRQSSVIGIFTGQGAQWPSMGRELFRHCSSFRTSIVQCEETLKTLADPPSWSLVQELSTTDDEARFARSELSQPLCTAVQISLVDVLRAAGVSFGAVIGHSSGEIAAAYAAGVLTRGDAMGIAFYRGLASRKLITIKSGAMLAVGMAHDAAVKLCSDQKFPQGITVAAHNSPSSITLSGDSHAIHEAKSTLDRDTIFTRLLNVDIAYHSQHMLEVADMYATCLEKLEVVPQARSRECIWYSTVEGYLEPDHIELRYWVDNLVKPVRFAPVLDYVLRSEDHLAFALEVGPHPALKGPVAQISKAARGRPLPYSSCLKRNEHDVRCLSSAVGTVWSHIGSIIVDLEGWRSCFSPQYEPKMLKNLPSYSWDHNEPFWDESRLSRKYRIDGQIPNELLGRLYEDCQYEMTWRNIICPTELPWLKGHVFQGQIIFPGAGYASMAVEAAKAFTRGRSMAAIQVQDLTIHKALAFNNDEANVEMLFTIRTKQLPKNVVEGSILEAEFDCYACSDGSVLEKRCDGHLIVHFDRPAAESFPPTRLSSSRLSSVDVEPFFEGLSDLGIAYSGVFNALQSISRVWGHANATAFWEEGQISGSYKIHPAVLDVGFQVGFATIFSLAEGTMGSPRLPSLVRNILINPTANLESAQEMSLGIEARLVTLSRTSLEVDICIYDQASGVTIARIEGLVLQTVSEPSPEDDRLLFAKTVWDLDASRGLPTPPTGVPMEDELNLIEVIERTSLYYLQASTCSIPPALIPSLKWHHAAFLRGIEILVAPVRDGIHPVWKKAWLNDDAHTINSLVAQYPDSVDLALLTAVGQSMPSVIRGESQMLEHMLKDDLLEGLYARGRGFARCNSQVAAFMQTITFKHPGLRILEIGAGTGSTTRSVLDAIGSSYSQYTCTDISAGFFEKNTQKMADHSYRMEFKTLNIENAPTDQGFAHSSFDVIIAANVLHATRSLSLTMKNVRSLLRPGGYLIAVEVTGGMLREHALMGGLEGWWLGMEDGRFPSPGITATKWHELLQECGFSGIDSIFYDCPVVAKHNCSVFVTRAIDDRFEFLLDPLSYENPLPPTNVLVIGGQNPRLAQAVQRVKRLLERRNLTVSTYTGINKINSSELQPGTSVLNLSELDQPLFSGDITSKSLESIQELLGSAANVLWVTCGRRATKPHNNMMIGVGRALAFELPELKMEYLDFELQESWDISLIVEHFLRMILLSSPQYSSYDALWVQEPEVVVNGSAILIPRLVRDDMANINLNASRRRITRHPAKTESIMVQDNKPQIAFGNYRRTTSSPYTLQVKLATPIYLSPSGSCFLCYAQISGSGTWALAVSERDCSTLVVPREDVFELPSPVNVDCRYLLAMAAVLIAHSVLYRCSAEGIVLVHQPTPNMVEGFVAVAKLLRRQVFFTSNSSNLRPDWVTLHGLASSKDIRRSLPANIATFWSADDTISPTLLSSLPQTCVIRRLGDGGVPCDPDLICTLHAVSLDLAPSLKPELVKIEDLAPSGVIPQPCCTVLDWQNTGHVDAIIPHIESIQLFPPDATYLLVGLAGELGQSICQFMFATGARHIVIASRTPVMDRGWLEEMRLNGADIRLHRADVANEMEVHDLTKMMRQSMPKVRGVMNAALVLDDSLFVHATAESIRKQLRPKVQGTQCLDEEFLNDQLDFFIAFSSLATVYGNAGQSIYHAANMFMSSLIEQRRRRGYSASIINIGMLVDVGYVAKKVRGGANLEQHLRSQFYAPLSESDLHHLIFEAITRGDPQSDTGELTMGMQEVMRQEGTMGNIPWLENPRFGHLVHMHVSAAKTPRANDNSETLRDILNEATSFNETSAAIQEMLYRKLQALLGISTRTIDINAPLADLGLDSLLAVEIRAWLMKELQADVPIFQILSRDPLASLIASTTSKYMENNHINEKCLQASTPVGVCTPDTTTTASNDGADCDFGLSKRLDSEKPQINICPAPSTSGGNTPTQLSVPPDGRVMDIGASGFATPQTSSLYSEPTDWVATSKPETTSSCRHAERASFPQASLYFLHHYFHDSTTFNVVARYSIKGSLNVGRLCRALKKVLQRHEAYHTRFNVDSGYQQLMQSVWSPNVDGHPIQVRSATPEEVEVAFAALAKREWKLDDGTLFEAQLLTQEPGLNTLLVGCHHIIMDGWSWHIFLRDLDLSYGMLPLPPITATYRDFSRRQVESLHLPGFCQSLDYWVRGLSPSPDVLPLLPTAKCTFRTASRICRNHIVRAEIHPATIERIRSVSQVHGTSPMQFCLSTAVALFAQLHGLRDMCIGVTDSGRNGSSFQDTIGHFVNLLPMRFNINSEQAFTTLLKHTCHTYLEGLNHAVVPVDLILEKLGLERSSVVPPLFQVGFNYRVGSLLHGKLGNCSMDLREYRDARLPYDFTFNVTQAGQGLLLELVSNDNLYTEATTSMLLEMYVRLLDLFCNNPSKTVDEARPYPHDRVQAALELGQGPSVPSPWPDTMTERFQQVYAAFPTSVAIQHGTQHLTYQQLAERVASIAEVLEPAEPGGTASIAVLCEPSIDLYAAMLGIMSVGATYFPVDETLPTERHVSMIRVAKPTLILCHTQTLTLASQYGRDNQIPVVNLSYVTHASGHAPLYSKGGKVLVFTSGSTGIPKGIVLPEKGIMNYAASKSARLTLGRVKVLQQSSVGFDMSIAQAFNAFANAGTLVIAPKIARGDPLAIAKLMVDEGIQLTIATPSEYSMLMFAADTLRGCASWSHACSGGESIPDDLVSDLRRLRLPNLVVTDCYGPTEVSCAVTLRKVPLHNAPEISTVGTPINHTSVYILGGHGNLLPVGLTGEICVGGYGVAQGYLNTDLDTDKFVPNPYATERDKAAGHVLMYKTGDRGFLREDGSVVFLGRMHGDTVIKLRGFRIDLNEVGNVIRESSRAILRNVVVTVHGQAELRFMVAHVVHKDGEENVRQSDLYKLLATLPLPRYMIPSRIIAHRQLPMTANGKVDRQSVSKLPLPEHEGVKCINTTLTVPEGELRLIWREVLGEALGGGPITADTDFFTVGGSSLHLVRLQNALKDSMGVVLPLHKLYKASSLKKMAALASDERGALCEETIDWIAETSIPLETETLPVISVGSPTNTRQRQVLLTGAAEFLGSEILAILLADPNVAKVHCIAVSKESEKRSLRHEKLSVYLGSLGESCLGLSSLEVAQLQDQIDIIIHAGSQGHCLNSYASVKGANYISTKFLASIALHRQIPFHFVSSGRVILQSGSCSMAPVSLAAMPPPTDGSQGFTASKWASERFLENISQATGLQVVIHRTCSLIGPNAPHDDAMNSVIRYSTESGMVPDIPTAEGFFDFDEVSKVAASIAMPEDSVERGIQFRHHSSGVKIAFNQLGRRMESLYGGSYQTVNMKDWLRKAVELGIEDLIVSYLEATLSDGGQLKFPYLGN